MIPLDQLEYFKKTLTAGNYNLLLGSGVSLDSLDAKGDQLKSAWDLTQELCVLKNVSTSTPLSRVALALTDKEVEKYLTNQFSKCKPGETVKKLTSFVWRNAFTFNIDDALEAAYERTIHPRQKTESLNHDSFFKSQATKSVLSVIHLHGYAREPEKKYIFSAAEYGRTTRNNAWMHILSELLSSEPFIIAGTSLNEPDLEYYLAGRTDRSGRSNRGPSILVDPNPDSITEIQCDRLGLTLVKATLSEFLNWVSLEIGAAPTVAQLMIPSIDSIFKVKLNAEDKILFFSTFEFVKPGVPNSEGEMPLFYMGKRPTWSDLESSADVQTVEELRITSKVKSFFTEKNDFFKVFCLVSQPGNGKTTSIFRAAYDLMKDGYIVFSLRINSHINAEKTAYILNQINQSVILLVDNLGDHVNSIKKILSLLAPRAAVAIISADRDYRIDHIDRVFDESEIDYIDAVCWECINFEKLISKLTVHGLIASNDAINYPSKFAMKLMGDPVAVAACRAMNNFRPLDVILKSLWNDSNGDSKRSYAVASLAEHCYSGGVQYPILEKSFPNSNLRDQIEFNHPLPLTYADGDYVYPLNQVIADKLLHMLAREKDDVLLEVFCGLAIALAPYVNRQTIIARTPEARLSARLFSAEKVVRPLLGRNAGNFFHRTHEYWKWNPRYWEQRAILTQMENIDLAIQYARHAVSLEEHPFPWTTLASLLGKKLEAAKIGHQVLFDEIYDLIVKVVKYEKANNSWISTPHPYIIILLSLDAYLSKSEKLVPQKKIDWIKQQIDFCQINFKKDKKLLDMCSAVLLKI